MNMSNSTSFISFFIFAITFATVTANCSRQASQIKGTTTVVDSDGDGVVDEEDSDGDGVINDDDNCVGNECESEEASPPQVFTIPSPKVELFSSPIANITEVKLAIDTGDGSNSGIDPSEKNYLTFGIGSSVNCNLGEGELFSGGLATNQTTEIVWDIGTCSGISSLTSNDFKSMYLKSESKDKLEIDWIQVYIKYQSSDEYYLIYANYHIDQTLDEAFEYSTDTDFYIQNSSKGFSISPAWEDSN